jgi:hypothetical protein
MRSHCKISAAERAHRRHGDPLRRLDERAQAVLQRAGQQQPEQHAGQRAGRTGSEQNEPALHAIGLERDRERDDDVHEQQCAQHDTDMTDVEQRIRRRRSDRLQRPEAGRAETRRRGGRRRFGFERCGMIRQGRHGTGVQRVVRGRTEHAAWSVRNHR